MNKVMSTLRRPRGRPFQAGNAGKPVGSKNRTTQLLERLAEGEAEQILQTLVEKAKAGDAACLRMLMDRLWPLRRGHPVELDVPPLNTATDVINTFAALWRGLTEGRLTPDEASTLSTLMERTMQVMTQQEILKRIEILEKDRELRDAIHRQTP